MRTGSKQSGEPQTQRALFLQSLLRLPLLLKLGQPVLFPSHSCYSKDVILSP